MGRLDTFSLEFENKNIMPKGMVMGRLDTYGLEFDNGSSRAFSHDAHGSPGMICTSWKFLVLLKE